MTAAPKKPATPNEAACVGPPLCEVVAVPAADPVVDPAVVGAVVVAFAEVAVVRGLVVTAGVDAAALDAAVVVAPPLVLPALVEPEEPVEVLPTQLISDPGLIVKAAD